MPKLTRIASQRPSSGGPHREARLRSVACQVRQLPEPTHGRYEEVHGAQWLKLIGWHPPASHLLRKYQAITSARLMITQPS
jgi:hypothetical protein